MNRFEWVHWDSLRSIEQVHWAGPSSRFISVRRVGSTLEIAKCNSYADRQFACLSQWCQSLKFALEVCSRFSRFSDCWITSVDAAIFEKLEDIFKPHFDRQRTGRLQLKTCTALRVLGPNSVLWFRRICSHCNSLPFNAGSFEFHALQGLTNCALQDLFCSVHDT